MGELSDDAVMLVAGVQPGESIAAAAHLLRDGMRVKPLDNAPGAAMNIAKLSIERPLNTWLIVVICLLGGIWGFNTVGKLKPRLHHPQHHHQYALPRRHRRKWKKRSPGV